MTQDQLMGLLRQVVPILAGVGITFGWLTQDQVAKGTQFVLSIAGPVVAIGSALWALKANSKASILASASQMPEVNSSQLQGAVKDPALKQVVAEHATPVDPDVVDKD